MSAEPIQQPEALFLRDLWYFGALSRDIKTGDLKRMMLLGEPVVVGRMKNGEAYALRDICPHRGVPLSAGKALSDNTVECPYHGWRFKTDGVCALIPSTVDGQDNINPENIRVRAYPVREQDGLIWIYVGANERAAPKNEPPRVPVPNAVPRWIESQTFACGIDHAVIGLMDPAHAPYVHGRWWWRVKPREKTKNYGPLPNGFVMLRHAPSKTAYKILGGANVSTEITFELPSTRFENIEGTIFGRHILVTGLTVCTPVDANTTQVTQIFFWPAWLSFIKPFFMVLGPTFLGDDRRIVELQKQGLAFNPKLMLIQDSDVPAMWYHRLKKAWAEHTDTGAPFVNPVKERTLRWRS
ncbi:MAG TPA: aromatic ring-hydroxylating dioxygenase subunit alpha [Rhizomicrobium sp.]|jgi:phenylpropionate dioxygenase-like ring-hydroxylating dioxygenase large terminal subunit|nr:aromatic ring-hydroxylating dioxygenase subunit alpha [Rhizomicrobium sp.]